MKVKLLTTLLFGSSLFANYINAYDNKNYKLAYALANKQCDKNCNNEQLNMILGLSAEKLGKSDEAIAAYERVLILNENNIEARLSLAGIYFDKGNSELMKTELEELQENDNLNKEQKSKINNMLKNISNSTYIAKPYNINLSIGFGYDSNPKHSNNKYINDFIDADYNYENTKSDSALSTILVLDAMYDHSINEKTKLNIFGAFYNKTYFKSKDKDYPDLSVISIGVVPRYEINDALSIKIGFNYDFVMLRRAVFLHSLNYHLELETIVNDFYLYSLTYNLENGIYDKNFQKDLNYYNHSLRFNNLFLYKQTLVFLALQIQKQKASNSIDPDSDYVEYDISAGAIYNITQSLLAKAKIGYSYTKYKQENELFLNKIRKDNDYYTNIGLEYKINKNQSLELSFDYSYEKSNQKINDTNNLASVINYKYSF